MSYDVATTSDARARCVWGIRVLCAALVLLVSAAFAPAARAQDDVLVVSVRDPVIVLGDETLLEIEVRDRRPDALRLPTVDGLTFGPVPSPFYHSQVVLVGQRYLRQESWIYHVKVAADRVGDYVIPPVTAVFGGTEVSGPSVELDVELDDRGEQSGVFAIEVPFERVVVGQGFPIEIQFGCRESVFANVRTWDVTLPWLSQLGREAVQEVPPSPRDGEPVEVTVNRVSKVRAGALRTVEIDGQRYRLYTLRLYVTPLRTGTVDLSGSVLRFRTGRIREGLVGREILVDGEFFKRHAPGSFEVVPLPEDGRPLGFTGAVGAFTAEASVDVAEMFAGDSFKLTVELGGSGNLTDIAAPNLELDPRFADNFALYGASEEREPDRFRVVYDLAPLRAEIDAVPPVGLWTFDPQDWSYHLVETEPVPIRVRARPGASGPTGGAAPEPREFERDIVDIETRALRAVGLVERAPRPWTIASLFGATFVLWGALRLATRHANDPAGSAAGRRRALAGLERELSRAQTPEQDLAAWTRFLAARLGDAPAAWIGRDVRRDVRSGRLELGPVALDIVVRTGERLESAAFGDGPRVESSTLVASARDLVEEGH